MRARLVDFCFTRPRLVCPEAEMALLLAAGLCCSPSALAACSAAGAWEPSKPPASPATVRGHSSAAVAGHEAGAWPCSDRARAWGIREN